MTDETSTSAPRSGRRAANEVPVDAEIVEDDTPAAAAPIASAPRTVEMQTDGAPAPQVVYIHAPSAPRKKGNRGIGALLAAVSGVVFAALLAVATAIIGQVAGGRFTFAFIADARFYIPVLFFILGFVLLVLVLNRAAWWAYILGSLLLALFVYFGSVGVGLLGQGVISHTPQEANLMFGVALRDPFVIVSALIAREVSIWVGAGIAFRGRRVKLRNIEAHANYEKELAEKRAEHERSAHTAV